MEKAKPTTLFFFWSETKPTTQFQCLDFIFIAGLNSLHFYKFSIYHISKHHLAKVSFFSILLNIYFLSFDPKYDIYIMICTP